MAIGHHTVLGQNVVRVAMEELGHVIDLAPIHSLQMEETLVLVMPFKQNHAIQFHALYAVQVSLIRSFGILHILYSGALLLRSLVQIYHSNFQNCLVSKVRINFTEVTVSISQQTNLR